MMRILTQASSTSAPPPLDFFASQMTVWRRVLQRGEENHSQSRLLPSPYPYWGDEEDVDVQSPPRDPFVGLQKQMKIMNRNLTGKLEEMNGMQNVDTHVALSEIRGQLHELTRSVESCQTDVCEVKRDMIAIKHEIDSVQVIKDEIDDIRESLDRLEAESQRRKNKLLEQGLTFFLAYSIFSAVLGMLQFGYNTGVINAPDLLSGLQHILRGAWYAP